MLIPLELLAIAAGVCSARFAAVCVALIGSLARPSSATWPAARLGPAGLRAG